MTKYVKQELSKDFGSGERKCYYRIQCSGSVSTKDLIDEIASPGSGLSRGSVDHVYHSLCEKLSSHLAKGKSVTLDDIGTFMATIALDSDKQMDSIDGSEVKRNAASLHISGVNFRASRNLISNVDSLCTFKRGIGGRICKSPYTKEERINRAIDYLNNSRYHFMHVGDYASLNHLTSTTAARELRKIAEDEKSGITFVGTGNAKIYVLK